MRELLDELMDFIKLTMYLYRRSEERIDFTTFLLSLRFFWKQLFG